MSVPFRYTLAQSRITNITASSYLLFEDIYLKCEVQGHPSPDVWWTRESVLAFHVANRTLVIRRAKISDIGTYCCHARNNLSYVNASFQLNLIDVPSIHHIFYNAILHPWDKSTVARVHIFIGQKYFIECISSGYPNVRVTWKRNGVEIVDYLNASLSTRVCQRRRKYGNSELNFKKVYRHDAGKYSCESSIDGYEYVDTRVLELIDIPIITISTNAPKYTLSGTEIQFACDTAPESFGDIEAMELVKDGVPFYQPIERYSRFYSTSRFVAQKKDTGKIPVQRNN